MKTMSTLLLFILLISCQNNQNNDAMERMNVVNNLINEKDYTYASANLKNLIKKHPAFSEKYNLDSMLIYIDNKMDEAVKKMDSELTFLSIIYTTNLPIEIILVFLFIY